jgi:fumarate reductase flavoprotein subunit
MSPAKKATVTEKASFEVSPPPIPAKDIKETVTADVVVLGAGISGLTAAFSAAEAGARTVLLEKGPGYNFRGLHNAAISSRLQKQAGVEIDRDQLISTIMEYSAYRGDQKVINTWADNCDKVLEWLIDMAEAANKSVVLDTTTKPWYFPNYPVAHVFERGKYGFQATLAKLLWDNVQAKGVEVHFNTPAVRLLREGKKRVTGVIARNKQGDYIQFNASRAVVLCTGDYGGDREMVKQYCWKGVHELRSLYPEMTAIAYSAQQCTDVPKEEVNTGDGQKMGMWIGAAIDDPPHCAMLFDYTDWGGESLFDLGRQPWLYVNLNGERFMNEDLPWGYECAQIMRQSKNLAWSVWDDKWKQEAPLMRSQCCKNMGPPTYLWQDKWLDSAIEEGNVLEASTIEELAQKMQLPVDKFKATVARYNELAKKGKDLDFGKHPDRLTTLEKPPFYATRMTALYLVIVGGLQINERLQVLDTERNVIPGLYAAGNASGSFFGSHYPTTVPGLSHSRAWTFGRLAGQYAAAEKV